LVAILGLRDVDLACCFLIRTDSSAWSGLSRVRVTQEFVRLAVSLDGTPSPGVKPTTHRRTRATPASDEGNKDGACVPWEKDFQSWAEIRVLGVPSGLGGGHKCHLRSDTS
jgi:hypothetical protein